MVTAGAASREGEGITRAALSRAVTALIAELRVYRSYATGRRKESVARVWIKPGRGVITINGKDEKVYFARPVLRMILRQPLIAAARDGQFDVIVTVNGGGLSGQAGAVRHGISRALVNYEPALRAALKPGGFLTRDPRAVERKKYGRPKARRSFQFSKR